MISGRRGFTLIELLLVISIIGMLFAVAVPVSYSMYKGHKASLKAEEVLLFLSTQKMESFLYGQERLVHASEGRVMINDNETRRFEDVFVQIDKPVKFFKNGTTSGGTVKVYADGYPFIIDVRPPFGTLLMKRSG